MHSIHLQSPLSPQNCLLNISTMPFDNTKSIVPVMNPKTPWNSPLTIITRCFTTVRALCTTSIPRPNMAWKTASMELNRWTKMRMRDRKKELTEPDIEGDISYHFEGSEERCLWSVISIINCQWPAPLLPV